MTTSDQPLAWEKELSFRHRWADEFWAGQGVPAIGAGEWRAAMPVQGTGRRERYALMDSYLDPIQAWLDDATAPNAHPEPALFQRIQSELGKPDPAKRFLAALLVSVLRSQQREPKIAQRAIERQEAG